MVGGCNKTYQITFLVVTLYMFHVFLKVFTWILNLYFCFYLDDLDIGDFIDDITAIDNITKSKLSKNHFKPDHNYKFPSKFQHGCMRALNYHWLASFPFLAHTVNDTILCFVYHAPYLTNQKFLKKVNFSKIQDFHRGLRLARFQCILVVKKLVKRTSVITLSILQ